MKISNKLKALFTIDIWLGLSIVTVIILKMAFVGFESEFNTVLFLIIAFALSSNVLVCMGFVMMKNKNDRAVSTTKTLISSDSRQ